MVGYESFDRAALPHRSWSVRPNPFRPGTSQPKSFVFTGVPRAGTAFSGNNINFDFDTSIEVKRTASKYHNQKRVLHSKGLRGLNGMPGSTTFKQTARKYNSQKYCKGV